MLKEPGIAIQGFEGSFHQVAARQFFGSKAQVNCCATFKELINAALDPAQTSSAVMAIENSIAGSILPNYNLLQQAGLTIIGEVYLQINQNLLVNRGVLLEDIREVHSHPMAIQQCLEYLEKYNWKLVETEDTAGSARQIYQHRSNHIAAIASKLAADLYNLDVIAKNVHTQKANYTRFLVLNRPAEAVKVEDADKASINFTTDHAKGSLVKVLSLIADQGINLSKLQSFPIPGSNFKYSFHADLEFKKRSEFESVIKQMKHKTSALKIYGLYKNGQQAKPTRKQY